MKKIKIFIGISIFLIIIFFMKEYTEHKIVLPFNYDFIVK